MERIRDLKSLYFAGEKTTPAKSAAVATPPPPPVDRWQRIRARFATGSDAGELRVASPDVCHWPPPAVSTGPRRDFGPLGHAERLERFAPELRVEGQRFVARLREHQHGTVPTFS
jgi:hypothetical protein